MQNDRDRLIELIDGFVFGTQIIINSIEWDSNKVKELADYLIANGVIVPPVSVGDKVYLLEDYGYKSEIKEKEIGAIVIKGTNDFSKVFWEDVYGGEICTFADVGKSVFLTKEEAEQARAKRNEAK